VIFVELALLGMEIYLWVLGNKKTQSQETFALVVIRTYLILLARIANPRNLVF